MQRRFRFTFEVDETNENQAFNSLLFRLKVHGFYKNEVTNLGFVHPDGKVRKCDLAPEGFTLIERGEKSYVAIPNNHNWTQEKTGSPLHYYLPLDALRWNNEKKIWEPIGDTYPD